ncbi:unnamed protein product [Strongylus vulgaris]|uniref:Uncharacterized protein n=1 Tax=Strongylus vulgaris TaxID=40348 RepID=A0A3P7JE17_STRVU|nr:unnamed protein product [Strongylus vulgaris]
MNFVKEKELPNRQKRAESAKDMEQICRTKTKLRMTLKRLQEIIILCEHAAISTVESAGLVFGPVPLTADENIWLATAKNYPSNDILSDF